MGELTSLSALFLITPGRSGTKALVDFCSRNTDMFCVHAPKPWVATAGFHYYQGNLGSEAAQWAFYSTREPYLDDAYRRGQVFFDGDCKNLPLTLEIAKLMPNARFIHVVRKPEDFVKSGLRRGYFDEKSAEMWGHLISPELTYESSNLQEQIRRIALFWEAANMIAEQAKVKLGEERVVTVRAEDMFQEPKFIFQALTQLGLGDEVKQNPDSRVRKLNAQKGKNMEREALEMIPGIVANTCRTAQLYY